MNYEKTIARADAIADKSHAGQTRWDGSPYIGHPRAVKKTLINGVFQIGNRKIDLNITSDYDKAMFACVGVLHDTFEDDPVMKQRTYGQFADLWDPEDTDPIFITKLWHEVQHMTRLHGESYAAFIFKAKASYYSKYGKLADIEHNLRDLKPGAMRDKYMLAACILLDENIWV